MSNKNKIRRFVPGEGYFWGRHAYVDVRPDGTSYAVLKDNLKFKEKMYYSLEDALYYTCLGSWKEVPYVADRKISSKIIRYGITAFAFKVIFGSKSIHPYHSNIYKKEKNCKIALDKFLAMFK